MEQYGLADSRLLACHGKPSDRNGYDLTRSILSGPNRPTALFTGNNMLTLGALRAIRDAGLTIPDDIAIVAFDDLEWMTLMQPQLTVAAQPTYEPAIQPPSCCSRIGDRQRNVKKSSSSLDHHPPVLRPSYRAIPSLSPSNPQRSVECVRLNAPQSSGRLFSVNTPIRM